MVSDAWNALAEATVSCADEATAEQMSQALHQLGLADRERAAIEHAVAGRQDRAGLLLRSLVDHAPAVWEDTGPAWGGWGPAEMDRAIEVAAGVESDPAIVRDPVFGAELSALQALPPDRAGALVLALVLGALHQDEASDRHAGLLAAVMVGETAPMTRLPVAELIAAASATDEAEQGALAVVLARVPRERLVRGIAAALRDAPDPSVPSLVAALAAQAGRAHRGAAMAAPPPSAGSPAPPEPVYRGGQHQSSSPPEGEAATALTEGEEAVATEGEATGPDRSARTAYPRIDLDTGTERHDVVVVDQPFTATIGLGPRPSAGILSTGAISTASQVIEVVLLYDPTSLTPQGETRHRLTITDEDPYPTVAVTITASYLENGPPSRRIGVQYLVDGQVVGLAWRSFVAVDEPGLVAGALGPPARERELLDLGPLLVQDAPDLVLAVFASDTSSQRWVWTMYAADPTLTVPDAPNTSTLDGAVADFALATRRAIQFSSDRVQDYFTLAGRAKRIGASVPAAVHRALGALLTQEGRTSAPSVLLLTEELVIPWELAAVDPPVATVWGGDSPFLGAHVAVGRWPLTEHRPRPVPRSRVQVRSAAVVTADYTGVPGWGRLGHAQVEAEEVAALFTPPATQVEPELLAVIDLLRGSPPADVLHVALHGQFDHEGDQEGIVLVRREGEVAKAQFLTPIQVENGELGTGPFVFLNACQVGADERVLGSYGGFASTLLRIGAGGVLAPLWNIDDDIAADVAREFYALTLGADQLSVAEAMRSIRTGYTESAVREGAPGASATLLAFQVFGHPRLHLDHSS